MEKMVLEQELRRGLEEQNAKPKPPPTSTAQSQRGEEVGGSEWREKGGRRASGEAGNEAQGSFAKIQRWSEKTRRNRGANIFLVFETVL